MDSSPRAGARIALDLSFDSVHVWPGWPGMKAMFAPEMSLEGRLSELATCAV